MKSSSSFSFSVSGRSLNRRALSRAARVVITRKGMRALFWQDYISERNSENRSEEGFAGGVWGKFSARKLRLSYWARAILIFNIVALTLPAPLGDLPAHHDETRRAAPPSPPRNPPAPGTNSPPVLPARYSSSDTPCRPNADRCASSSPPFANPANTSARLQSLSASRFQSVPRESCAYSACLPPTRRQSFACPAKWSPFPCPLLRAHPCALPS